MPRGGLEATVLSFRRSQADYAWDYNLRPFDEHGGGKSYTLVSWDGFLGRVPGILNFPELCAGSKALGPMVGTALNTLRTTLYAK